MEYFNKYGATPLDGPIDKAYHAIGDIADKLFNEMLANGASPVEIRAVAECLSFGASGGASIAVLKFAAKMRKQEKEEGKELKDEG